jgi:hypothetical protein
MQQCFSTCEPDIHVEKSACQQTLAPCEFCFEPTNSVIMTDIFNTTRDRLSSEPVSVPDPSTIGLINNQQRQSQSSGYESAFGNGLSPTTNYWTSGVNDSPSCVSSVCDDLLNDQDQSIFDESSTTDGVDDDIDDDSFEVLSFEAPPESTLYIKGIFLLNHFINFII